MKPFSPFTSICLFGSIIIFFFTACNHDTSDYSDGSYLYNTSWEFTIDTTDSVLPEDMEATIQSGSWEKINLPHTPKIEPLIVNNQWQGTCWYRKDIEYMEEWKDKHIYIRFEGAMNIASVWLNNKQISTHLGGYLPFTLDITQHLNKSGKNRLYVRLNNEDNPITGPKPLKILDFNTYGGLYRDVKIISKNDVHITDEQYANRKAAGGIFITYPLVSKEKAEIEVKTEMTNLSETDKNISIDITLLSNNKVIARKKTKGSLTSETTRSFISNLILENPLLWSPSDPNLYTLEMKVKNGKEMLDYYTSKIGIRSFEFKGKELYINGEKTFLRGVNRHQEYPYLGYALSNNAQYRDARTIKEAGFDYVRLAHYPHSSAFLDACDELGLVTVNPILGWQFYNPDPAFTKYVLDASRSLIRRDRNHACVLAWELSLNESHMPRELIDSLVKIGREEYPIENCYIAGWKEYGYDIYLQARQHRHSTHFPDKPYIVSEYGDWEYYAQNAGLNQDAWSDLKPEQRSSRQLLEKPDAFLLQQALNIQEAHNDNLENTPAFADGYWVMFDYNRGYADDLEASGIMSIFRQPKFSYYFFQSQRDPDEIIDDQKVGPMVYIASRMMDDQPGRVKVFSNCDEVELLVNDKSIGTQKPDNDAISGSLPHPPFTFITGETIIQDIRAIGLINGEEVTMDYRKSPGKVSNIDLKADLKGKALTSGSKDIVFIHARLQDEDNQLVFDQDQKIEFTVEGDAEIIGMSNPHSEAGIATILLRSGSEAGEIIVHAKLDDTLKTSLVLINE